MEPPAGYLFILNTKYSVQDNICNMKPKDVILLYVLVNPLIRHIDLPNPKDIAWSSPQKTRERMGLMEPKPNRHVRTRHKVVCTAQGVGRDWWLTMEGQFCYPTYRDTDVGEPTVSSISPSVFSRISFNLFANHNKP